MLFTIGRLHRETWSFSSFPRLQRTTVRVIMFERKKFAPAVKSLMQEQQQKKNSYRAVELRVLHTRKIPCPKTQLLYAVMCLKSYPRSRIQGITMKYEVAALFLNKTNKQKKCLIALDGGKPSSCIIRMTIIGSKKERSTQ